MVGLVNKRPGICFYSLVRHAKSVESRSSIALDHQGFIVYAMLYISCVVMGLNVSHGFFKAV